MNTIVCIHFNLLWASHCRRRTVAGCKQGYTGRPCDLCIPSWGSKIVGQSSKRQKKNKLLWWLPAMAKKRLWLRQHFDLVWLLWRSITCVIISGLWLYLCVDQRNTYPVIVEQQAALGSVIIQLLQLKHIIYCSLICYTPGLWCSW